MEKDTLVLSALVPVGAGRFVVARGVHVAPSLVEVRMVAWIAPRSAGCWENQNLTVPTPPSYVGEVTEPASG